MSWFTGVVRRRRRGLQGNGPGANVVKWRHSDRRLAAQSAADAAAFLNGRLVERAERLKVAVPVWAWTNLLAHGSRQDLVTESGRVWSRWDCSVGVQWRRARSYLAGEVLLYAGPYGSLAEVQRVVLVPLELSLAATPEVADWRPSRWALAVESALTQQHHVGHQG